MGLEGFRPFDGGATRGLTRGPGPCLCSAVLLVLVPWQRCLDGMLQTDTFQHTRTTHIAECEHGHIELMGDTGHANTVTAHRQTETGREAAGLLIQVRTKMRSSMQCR